MKMVNTNIRWLRPMVAGTLLAICIGAGFLAAAWWFFQSVLSGLPQIPEDPIELRMRRGTSVYAANGSRIFSFNEAKKWVPLSRISPYVVQALSATEDARFFQHHGIDLKALTAAVWINLRHGFGTRGGSTLTQQLVKRLFFSPEKTFRRKLGEILLALELEALFARSYPGTSGGVIDAPVYKNRLLELYLNTVFYGANAYGLADAALVYYGRSPRNLTLPQAALLMGVINAPSTYNPLQHPERATRRLQHVLDRMRQTGYLSASARSAYRELKAEDLIDPHKEPQNPAPYWVEAVKAEISRRYGSEALRYGALDVHTTLDPALQRAAEEAVDWGVRDLDQKMGFPAYETVPFEERNEYVQAALVCIDPHTGHVKAMVGGRDIFISYYNRALTARRQPGSGFKPVAYLAALEAGAISPVSLFMDEPKIYLVKEGLWQPRNYDDVYLGLITGAGALIHSANSTAVQITHLVGPKQVAGMARRLGFAGALEPVMSIGLGVNEVTVLEMASAYGSLAAAGLLVEPTLVARVLDSVGNELFAHEPRISRAVEPDLAFQMVALLEQVLDRGTGRRIRRLGFGHPAAGKTGTTNDNTDAWFTGFTPYLVTSVWIGFDDRSGHQLIDTEGNQITGAVGAAPLWTRYMSRAVENIPPTRFSKPSGLHRAVVSSADGTAIRATVDHLSDSLASQIPDVASLPVFLRAGERTNTVADLKAFRQRRLAEPDTFVVFIPVDP